MEMVKYNDYIYSYGNWYFWRDYKGAEIDIILERDGIYSCYECKRSETKKASIPNAFATAMSDKHITYTVINPKTFIDLVIINKPYFKN